MDRETGEVSGRRPRLFRLYLAQKSVNKSQFLGRVGRVGRLVNFRGFAGGGFCCLNDESCRERCLGGGGRGLRGVEGGLSRVLRVYPSYSTK